MQGQPPIPNTNQKTVHAFMRVKSFVSPENPTPEQVTEYDKEINTFMETVDNTKRFLNGRNAYSLGNRIYVLVWYLESIPDQPVTTPFGAGATEVKPPVEPSKPAEETGEKKNEQNPNPEQPKN